jgi:hypothetical protein
MKTKSKYTQPQLHQRKPNIAPIGGVPAPLKHIELACEQFANDRREIASQIHTMERDIARITANYMPQIRSTADVLVARRADLAMQIDSNRPLFEKPRTRIFSDIKVGLQKQKGSIDFEDEEKTIALIEKHFPDRLDDLAPATRKLSKTALANLTAADLKKIGVEITADTDAVLIKPQDSDVEKAVAALLAETNQPDLAKAA